MNNEPVAWGWYDLEIKRFFPHWDEDLMENKEGCISLYTHPAKTLTDQEILLFTGFKDNPYDIFIEYEKEDLIEFARAILRKAQEQ